MWRPALFLLTIVLVTPQGRAAFGAAGADAMLVFETNLPYSGAILLTMIVCAVASMMLLRKRPSPTDGIDLVYHQVRGETADEASRH